MFRNLFNYLHIKMSSMIIINLVRIFQEGIIIKQEFFLLLSQWFISEGFIQ